LRLAADLEDETGNPRIDFRSGDFFVGGRMHFYWRIKEELLYLGEVLVFVDPCLIREYRRWVERKLSRVRNQLN
jgi:hypothetical protein